MVTLMSAVAPSGNPDASRLYSIGDLAQEFGISPRAIRFYEDQALLAPQRLGGNRIYTYRDYARLVLILRGKRLGFSLADIKEMLDLCDTLGDGLGVAVDVYHVWWDPELPQQIARAGSRIIAHHINDWLVPTTDMLNDRGMMGDGVIDLIGIRRMIEAAGYRGIQEVEIFSDMWWNRPGDELLKIAIERFHAVCQAD